MQRICTGVAQAGSQQPSHKALGHYLTLHFWLSTRHQLCQHTCSTRQVAATSFLQAQAKESEHTVKHDVDVGWLTTSGWLGTEHQLCHQTCSTRQVAAACFLQAESEHTTKKESEHTTKNESEHTTKNDLSLSWLFTSGCACLASCASRISQVALRQFPAAKSQRTVLYNQAW